MSAEQKIALGEMRSAGVRQLLIYCSDHHCSHCVTVEACADRWPDELRLSDIEGRFVCTVCGRRGADVRPDWSSAVKVLER